jgi:hypothetical protein
MRYEFLNKAQNQPDLADFCEYIKKPLMVLEDILHRYEELQIAKKITTENLEIRHKCDSILQKYLPEMVDNFCDFSFEYRNNKKIRIDGNTVLTPKEILLKNLGKIIEEVRLIEDEFNHNNSFQTVIQTKILSSYGFQPELSLEKGGITKDSIELNNKFNYEEFVESNKFKKSISIQKQNEKLELINDNQDDINDIKINRNNSFIANLGLFDLIITVMSIALMASIFFASSTRNKEPIPIVSEKDFISNLVYIRSEVNKFYKDSNYENLSMDELIKAKVIAKDQSYTPWGTPIKIYPAQGEHNFVIMFYSKRNDVLKSCQLMSSLLDHFDVNFFNDTNLSVDQCKSASSDFINNKSDIDPPFLLFSKNI